MSITFETKVQFLKGVGPKMAEKLKKLGIETVADLIYYFPRTYNDYTQISKISDLARNNNQETITSEIPNFNNQTKTIKGKIINIANRRTSRRRFTVTEAVVADETGSIKVVWFNQPYLEKTLKAGNEVILSGKVTFNYLAGGIQMESPVRVGEQKIVAIYPETAGITSNYVARLVNSEKRIVNSILEYLPEEIIKKNGLIGIQSAILNLHQPENLEILKKAQERMAFDELFLFSLQKQLAKRDVQIHSAPKMKIDENFLQKFVKSLPFKLTDAQRKASWKIIKDISSDKPMSRLLNGDVGSGKTVVAAFTSAIVVKNGFRVALMAPTEILANQHFATLSAILKPFNISVELITSATRLKAKSAKSNKGHPELVSGSQKNEIPDPYLPAGRQVRNDNRDILVGTHALLHLKKPIENLGLVIIDEQHRFGVEQREKLLVIPDLIGDPCLPDRQAKIVDSRFRGNDKFRPHYLSMTATPIPRTMSLVVFADLDVSVIDEMPANRKKVTTKIIAAENRQKAYDFIRSEVKKGHQVFVICPVIDSIDKTNSDPSRLTRVEAEKLITNSNGISLFEDEKKSVVKEFEKLSKQVFPDLKIGMIHGKLKSKEKDQIMTDFKNKKFDILVSTSVVEVGVDIPNATVMMIEGAERFGLAQLHQFRGRVGRSDKQSYCLLFSGSNSENSKKRLSYLEKISSGFELAEKDLELRGPGQVYGSVQSGFWDFRFAEIGDKIMIERSTEEAKKIAGEIEKYPLLLEKVGEVGKHLE